MAELDQLYTALKNADAAGDTAGAQKLAAYIKAQPTQAAQPAAPAAEPEPSMMDSVKQGAANLGSGLVRGAGSIGATILYPVDKITDMVKGDRDPSLTQLVTGQKKLSRNEERRQAMDSALTELTGSDPNSLLYKTGKLGGEIAGTAGVGSAIAPAAKVLGAAPELVNAIRTAGMTTGGTGLNLGTRALGGAINGGASAALVDPNEAKSGALIGAALPPALAGVGKLGAAAGRALAPTVAPEVKALAQRASDLGIEIPADRITNSKPLNAVAAGLNYIPFSGRSAVENRMHTQLDTALSRTFGQDSPNVTMALRKAQTELGGKFDSTLKNNSVSFDKKLLDDIGTIQESATKELGADGLRAINGQIDELVAKGGTGLIDGQAAYNIKRTLDRIGARSTPEAFQARELKKALMGALDRSLGPEEAAAFAKTRQQYGNMMELEGLAQNGAEGGLSIARVANMKGLNNPDLQELADIAAQFIKPREGMHGAAQRAGAGLGIGAVAGPAALAGTVAAGRVANHTLDSTALRNLVLGKSGPAVSDPTAQLLYRSAPQLGQ